MGLLSKALRSIGGMTKADIEAAARRAEFQATEELFSRSRRPEARGMTPTRMGVPDQTKWGAGEDDMVLSPALRRLLDDPSTRALSDDIDNASIFERGPTALSYLHKDGRTNIFDLETDAAARGKGNARATMEEFLRGQDASGRATYLTASPTDNRTTQAGLDRFYSSLGFNPVDDAEGFALRRDPKFGGGPMVGGTPEALARAREQGFDVDTPLYHGTGQDFTSFDPAALGGNTGSPSAKKAFFFSSDPEVAGSYKTSDRWLSPQRRAERDEALRPVEERYAKDAAAVPRGKGILGMQRAAMQRSKLRMAAEDEAARIRDEFANKSGPSILPVYLRNPDPLVRDFGGAEWRADSFADLLDKAASEGRTGAVFKNVFDGGVGSDGKIFADVHTVFDPKNIRSRFAAFDPSKSDSSDLLAMLALATLPAGGLLSRAQRERQYAPY